MHLRRMLSSHTCSDREQDVEEECMVFIAVFVCLCMCVRVQIMYPSYLCVFVYVDEGEIKVHPAGQ